MRKLLIGLLCAAPLALNAQDNLYFTMRPALSPDAKAIYFEYDSDIWRVDANGGNAARITAMEGDESYPMVSPDGKWLAFASNQNGNNDVYITPVAGGELRQLTFNNAGDVPTSWAADSKTLNYESGQYNSLSSFKVSIDGGTAKRLFPHYFNTIANLNEMANGNYLFNESTESYRYATRKGYKGDHNPNIKMWNPKTNKYSELTTYNGKDIWPTTDQNNTIYFVTDQSNGEANLAVLEGDKTKVLTSFNESIQYPKVSFNGEKVAFNKDYKIYVYDTKSGKTTQPKISLTVDNSPTIENKYSTKQRVENYAVSPDGKKIAFVSRGRLFVSGNDGKIIKELNTDKRERAVELAWAADNNTIYFTRTRSGWYNLFSINANSNDVEKSLYTPNEFIKNVTINNKNNALAFTTGGNRLEMWDGKGVQTLSDKVEFWTFRGYSLNFSKDDRYLVFNAVNLFESDAYVYDFANKSLTNITNTASTEMSPALSADNKNMFITANRYSATFPRGASYGSTGLFKIPLDKYETPYDTDKYNALFSEKKKDSSINTMSFNAKNIHRRWEKLAGNNVGSMSLINVKGIDYLVFSSSHDGKSAPYIMKMVEGEDNKPQLIKGATSLYRISTNGTDVYALNRGDLYKININAHALSATKIELSKEFAQTNSNEFMQMAYETWAQMSSSFYDPKMHGVDWKTKLKYYTALAPYAQSRADLRLLLNDMLNELNSSHLGFNSSGVEERRSTSKQTAYTGVMFNNDRPYEIDYIVEGSPADKKSIDIKKGDKLVAVNSARVDEKTNRDIYFTSAVRQPEVTLTLARAGKEFDVTLRTISSGELKNLLYFEWEDACRQRVNKQSNSRVAYVHLRDMTDTSLDKFLIEMTTDAVHKDALIVDLRFNNGGNIHNEILEYLSQKSHFNWRFRDQKTNTHPNYMPGDRPIVVLINERSLSDAEVTSNGIRNLGIAKLIGTETYRWIIFTSSVGLADGSSIRMPAWGCYNLDGSDLELTGVKPDIYIKNTFDDRVNGRDPQLDRAIEEILKDLKK